MSSLRNRGATVAVVVAVAIGVGCGGETNPAMQLQFADRVFVKLDPEGLPAGAVGSRVVGNRVNLYKHFAHVETVFGTGQTGTAIVIYTNIRYLPARTVYVPMRPVTLFEAAMLDRVASGIVANPGLRGVQTYAMTTEQIRSALPRVMQHRPLDVGIQVADSSEAASR